MYNCDVSAEESESTAAGIINLSRLNIVNAPFQCGVWKRTEQKRKV